MRVNGRSDALLFSLSELAFVLLFVALSASVLFFARTRAATDARWLGEAGKDALLRAHARCDRGAGDLRRRAG